MLPGDGAAANLETGHTASEIWILIESRYDFRLWLIMDEPGD